ncbi:type I polyketide synthase [Stackebrandtia nassauensis]|uniref:Beta-ketoacyl synthase n=1 Tax=Stackebrandtia nassauensis (strain DSM 44728 / CIP 108903 / NRRL B-16338 / NBRC 102104 / LLR-40K-21) TaxID=446470 RepID=D3Q0V7_STANL|nr:type I polyketide synthase [Stackebrandtia nassauensis]ADD43707.1 Beta-ketoacyl synthase [Stackebrandtia nassauensis DSM 44728]
MNTEVDATHIAVIGMAGRFPGAVDLEQFWDNLAEGVESVRQLPAPEGGSHQPACGVLDEAEYFDCDYFGYAPREAMLIDPQHRLFMECAVEALEYAGEDPARYPGPIGVYGGASQSLYRETLRPYRDLLGGPSSFQMHLGSGSDFLTTRTSYQLNLRGPAVSVQTACSTSLVAIHQAVQALLAGECDIALAGGAGVQVPVYPGEYTEGGVLAADGHCRAFDAKASGMISGDGVGIVVLKRLSDAVAEGNTVHAVLLGTAVNNDGSAKIGFTAPSVAGQAEVMRTALELTEIEPDTVDYIEAHGTGTPLGDPIEIAALTEAYGNAATRSRTGWVGSVKTNIGHTDAAAGVAGFIKVVLALRNRQLPPSLNFDTPNPKIDFAASPFQVNTSLRDWDTDDRPRRAAVNSLGLGGTNAHAILEEAPDPGPVEASAPWQLVVVSARTESALAAARTRLAGHLDRHPDLALADVAWTTQAGRTEHPHRQSFVASSAAELVERLTEPAAERVDAIEDVKRPVVMVFPGQGGQRIGMARDLYRHVPVFRDGFDECAKLFAEQLGIDLRDVLYPEPGERDWAESELATMPVSHAAIFAVEHSLYRLWTHWGVEPDAVAGHSLGAYAAACAAGVFSLTDATAIVAERSRILGSLPEGAMLAVPLPEQAVAAILPVELSIAAINGPGQCVVSGPAEAIMDFARRMDGDGVDVRRLHIPSAAHSSLIEPRLPGFREFMNTMSCGDPRIPIVSDRTGVFLTAEQTGDRGYWTGHLRDTVRFGQTLSTMLERDNVTIVEAGPGHTLTTLAQRHPEFRDGQLAVPSLPHPSDPGSSLAHTLAAVGSLWSAGHGIDWANVHSGARRRRIPLPGYPFERTRFKVDPSADPPVAIEPSTAAAARSQASEAPVTGTEVAVAAVFQEILGVPAPGRQGHFFKLGGDSLLATQLTTWIRETYDVKVPISRVFRSPTVAALAELIDDDRTETETRR